MDIYDIFAIVVFIVVWYLLVRIILPRHGVHTRMPDRCDTQLGEVDAGRPALREIDPPEKPSH